jgi:hypothetical protein
LRAGRIQMALKADLIGACAASRWLPRRHSSHAVEETGPLPHYQLATSADNTYILSATGSTYEREAAQQWNTIPQYTCARTRPRERLHVMGDNR